ncbi:MAG: hypothetical protein Tsb0020_55050 [Haliangiales bacterium]
MASILVYIESLGAEAPGADEASGQHGHGESSVSSSLAALAVGRQLASALGASLHALVTVPTVRTTTPLELSPANEALTASMSRSGADRVYLAPVPPGPALWATHSAALRAACDAVGPRLVLFAATPAGRDMAPRLAAHLEAVLLDEPVIELPSPPPPPPCPPLKPPPRPLDNIEEFSYDAVTMPQTTPAEAVPRALTETVTAEHVPRGQTLLHVHRRGGAATRMVVLDELDYPCVITVPTTAQQAGVGAELAPVVSLADPIARATPEPPERTLAHLDSYEDPGAALSHARVIICVGAGAEEEDVALARALAEQLGAELGATAAMCARGLVPHQRAIGLGIRRVAPALYIACASSGSADHLGAVAATSAVVAINSDPQAPIFERAQYGIVGAISDVLPELVSQLRRRNPHAATP